MSEETTVEEQQLPAEPTEPVEQVVAEAPIETEPTILHYTYQPTDSEGRPMGGPQVIKYATQEELVTKLQEQNVLILRKLREETRKNRLGITEVEEIEESAPKYASPLEFKQRELSVEERIKLSQNILDPDKFSEVADTLGEYILGAKPEKVRKMLQESQERAENAAAIAESELFMKDNPDFVRCISNGEAVAKWVSRYQLAPVKENFQKAYNKLKADGLLVLTPSVPPPAEPVAIVATVEPVQQVVIPPVPPAAPSASIPGLPSGLNRSQGAADAGIQRSAGDDIVYEVRDRQGNVIRKLTGLAAVNAMPGEEMKRRMRNKEFVKAVDKLEADAAARQGRGAPSILDR